ncbi:MAG: DUF2490 domain-containing protein [Bacteroidetes bacterium]|nr:DUF2490 domain-containing protein [Bacteroidota bacterium]
MRFSIASIFTLLLQLSIAQNSVFQLWTETGFKHKLNKKVDLTVEWTNRFDGFGLNTSFPQASVRYKFLDWLKGSLDYRLIISKEKNGNFSSGNRVNANIQLNKKLDRFDVGFRARYQYSFNRFVTSSYDPEFDVAYRFRPSISYDIKNSIFIPNASAEFFYSPENAPLGNQFTRIRYQIGVDFETKLPLDIGIAYLYDNKINLPNAIDRHVLNLSATYLINGKDNKKKKEKENTKNPRDL